MSDIMDKILVNNLKGIYLFKDLEEAEILDFAKSIELKIFFEGQNLILEGSSISNIFILKEGKLVVKKANAHDSKILGYINTGEIFGEMSYINSSKPMASVIAKQDSDVWVISIARFESLLNNHPELREMITELIQKREGENTESLRYGGRSDSLNDLKFDFID